MWSNPPPPPAPLRPLSHPPPSFNSSCRRFGSETTPSRPLQPGQKTPRPRIRVHIEWCALCGSVYYGVMQRMVQELGKVLPDADVTTTVGRKTAFEVTALFQRDGKEGGEVRAWAVHSKLSTTKFPTVKEVAEDVARHAKDGLVPESWKQLPEAERMRVEDEIKKG